MKGGKEQFNSILFLLSVKDLDYYPRMFSDRDDHHKYHYHEEYLQLLAASLLNKLNEICH